MSKHNFGYFIHEGVSNMFSHGFMSFAAIGITVACLLIMGTFTLVAVNANGLLKDLERENEMLAFVEEDFQEPQSLQQKLEAIPNVVSATFISRQQAMENFLENYPEEEMFRDLDPNILRDRFSIKVADLERISQTKAAVDAVDGIELELSTEEIEYVNGYLMEYNALTGRPQGTDDMDPSQPGLVHLNGPQALAYCRNRYLGTDFGRTERQRKVLTAVIGKLPSNILTGAGDLINGLMPNLTTNLTRNECFRLSLMAGKLFTYEMVPDSIPQPGTYWNEDIRGMQVLGVDFDSNIRYLKEKLYGE